METLTDTARRVRPTHLRPPGGGLAVIVPHHSASGRDPVADVLLDAVFRAGFEGLEAAVVYRSVGDFVLSWCGGEASSRLAPAAA